VKKFKLIAEICNADKNPSDTLCVNIAQCKSRATCKKKAVLHFRLCNIQYSRLCRCLCHTVFSLFLSSPLVYFGSDFSTVCV